MSATTHPTHSPATKSSPRRWPIWITTLAAASAIPVLIWIVTDLIAGHQLVAVSGGTTMTVDSGYIVIGATFSTACGLGLAAILRRFTAKPRRNWVIVASVVLALSLLTPLGGTTALTVVVLMAMHLVVGAIAITGGLALLRRLGA